MEQEKLTVLEVERAHRADKRLLLGQPESERRFPCGVRIGARAAGWEEAEVQSWIVGRVEHHRARVDTTAPS